MTKMTPNEKLILGAILAAHKDGIGWQRASLIARRTGTSTQAISRTLASLVQKGLVYRSFGDGHDVFKTTAEGVQANG